MSCLKKVIDTVETECSKSFTNVVLWSDCMDTQFRSRFIFQLLAGAMFLNKSLYWFYNEGQHCKVPMDDVGETVKNVIFRKVKSDQIVVHTPKEFSDATMEFVPSIITVYLPRSNEGWKHPWGTIHPQNTFNPQICSTDQWQKRLQYIIFHNGGRPGRLWHSMVQQSQWSCTWSLEVD